MRSEDECKEEDVMRVCRLDEGVCERLSLSSVGTGTQSDPLSRMARLQCRPHLWGLLPPERPEIGDTVRDRVKTRVRMSITFL